MKLILSFFLLFSFVCNSLAAPLVFKVEKQLKLGNYVEVGNLDVSKYKQIKIVIISDNVKYSSSVLVEAVEGSDRYRLDQSDKRETYSRIFDLPPSKVSISVNGEGLYKLYVYGVQ